MKLFLLLIFFFYIPATALFCQNIDTLYYDHSFREATEKRYTFYRLVRKDSGIVKVFDYWKNGRIQMSGGYRSADFKVETGPFKYYKRDRITNIVLHEPYKYPGVLSSFSAILERIPKQPDSASLVIYFHKNRKLKAA